MMQFHTSAAVPNLLLHIWNHMSNDNVQAASRIMIILSFIDHIYLCTIIISSHNFAALVQVTLDAPASYWIGLNDLDPNKGWLWTDGSPNEFFYWADGKKVDLKCAVLPIRAVPIFHILQS